MAKDIKNNYSLRFSIFVYVELVAGILFSFLSFSPHMDISILAFILNIIFIAFSVYFNYFKIIRKKDSSNIIFLQKFSEYMPFFFLFTFVLRRAGVYETKFWYDFISVVLWCFVFIASIYISSNMNSKKLLLITKKWNVEYVKKPKLKGIKWVLYETVDWIDNIIQAIFIALLIQIFVVQLYLIPSESMVPTFLVKDKVVVTKINCGPKFPLTEAGLNDFTSYDRGDIIVVRNPHYRIDRKSEIKSVTSQLVYMLTFMRVNLNLDENGIEKYDPLVKRICGVPGEQLMMQDGVLYRRTQNSDIFEPVEEDEKFACWDLSKVNKNILPYIERFPLADFQVNKRGSNLSAVVQSASDNYEKLLELEQERRDYDLDAAAFRANEIVHNVRNLIDFNKLSNINVDEPYTDEIDLFNNLSSFASKIYTTTQGFDWFERFMTSWIDSKDIPKDMYNESNYRLNVMLKLSYGELVYRYLHLMKANYLITDLSSDPVVSEYAEKVYYLQWYITDILDLRNMPIFPENNENGNPEYIPEDCFFMMGDNRFNSLDFRHSADPFEKDLTSYDSMPVQYLSQMSPHYINKRYIIGKPTYRYSPLRRRGNVQPKK